MKRRYIYLEFLYPVRDYIETIKIDEALYEWGGPIIITLGSLGVLWWQNISISYIAFSKYIAGLMAILIGFSITSVTILSTASGETIDRLKKEDSERNIGGKPIKVYRWMLVNFTFALFGEILSIVAVSVLYVFSRCSISPYLQAIIFGINIWVVAHVVLLNIRNITNYYLVFSRPTA
ncbi:MAG: hypothetical protein LDL11_08535 [Desulfarculus sp.]|nr:hypothetical protein [Desulfarculus sp.]